MSLPRLRLEKCICKEGRWLIDQEQAHHLIRVRRCCTGSLAEKICLHISCEGELVFAEELSREAETARSIELHLMLALLKSDQFDQALRFAAETGVHTIHLLACERSVPQIFSRKNKKKKCYVGRRSLMRLPDRQVQPLPCFAGAGLTGGS